MKIITFHEKHADITYGFDTDDELRAAYLERLRDRQHPGYEWYSADHKPYFHNAEIKAVGKMTEDEYAATAAALPPALADALHKNRKSAVKAIREADEANQTAQWIIDLVAMPVEAALAATDADGDNLLDKLMWDREDYEYEGFDIETLHIAKTRST